MTGGRLEGEAHAAPPVDVVICVHNALDDVRRCVDSLAAAQAIDGAPYRMVLVDDGSNAETAAYLDEVAANPGVVLVRHATAGGYTKAANAGLRATDAELIVLLNSDTIVPAGWLAKLSALMRRFPDAGIIGPLSNAASWQSVPSLFDEAKRFAVNELPEGVTVDAYDGLLAHRVADMAIRPRVQILNGFCLMLRRAVIDQIGYLDEESFPRGYGEENDYCFRAADAGFGLMMAIDTYVFHAKSKSYGSATRDALSKAGAEALRAKYPLHRIEGSVRSLRENPLLAAVRARMAEA